MSHASLTQFYTFPTPYLFAGRGLKLIVM